MPAGPVTVLNVAMEKIGAADIDLAADSFRVVLCGAAQVLNAGFTGTSGEALYSDLTDEVSGTGYTPGGEVLASPAWTRAGAVVTFSADATSWDALSATVKYAAVVKSDGASPETLTDILAIVDVETDDPAGRVSAGGDFIINWTGGLFTLTRAT